MQSNRTLRAIVAVVGLIAAASLITIGTALAITSNVLADGNTANYGHFHSEQGIIKLETKDSIRIRDVYTTGAPPGFASPWHTHPGPVLVSMSPTSAGSLTIYDENCNATTLTAGEAYIEKPNAPVMGRNESSANADWVSTFIVPIGAAPTHNLENGPCAP
jgi:hypothetical protein